MRWSLQPIKHYLLVMLLPLGLSACLSISSESPAVQLYRLTAAEVQPREEARALSVQIESNSSRLLGSQRLWVLQADRRVQPMAEFRWAMPAPELFRQALIETLESSGAAVVVNPDAGGERLQLELRALQLEVDSTGHTQARVALLASWYAEQAAPVSQVFDVRRDAAITSAGSAAAALDQASQQLLVELTVWLLDQSRK